jgi:ABC-type phosphate/phosphonate transport system ATPase subunit
MGPLIHYYKRQARNRRQIIGLIYTNPYFVQRGHGLGNVLLGLYTTLRPILWSCAKSVGNEAIKALGRETLRTGTDIIIRVAANPPEQTRNIISRYATASTHDLIDKLRKIGSRKRKWQLLPEK